VPSRLGRSPCPTDKSSPPPFLAWFSATSMANSRTPSPATRSRGWSTASPSSKPSALLARFRLASTLAANVRGASLVNPAPSPSPFKADCSCSRIPTPRCALVRCPEFNRVRWLTSASGGDLMFPQVDPAACEGLLAVSAVHCRPLATRPRPSRGKPSEAKLSPCGRRPRP